MKNLVTGHPLEFEHRYTKTMYTDIMSATDQASITSISHVFEPKSRQTVNMVTYIFYINKKQAIEKLLTGSP